ERRPNRAIPTPEAPTSTAATTPMAIHGGGLGGAAPPPTNAAAVRPSMPVGGGPGICGIDGAEPRAGAVDANPLGADGGGGPDPGAAGAYGPGGILANAGGRPVHREPSGMGGVGMRRTESIRGRLRGAANGASAATNAPIEG